VIVDTAASTLSLTVQNGGIVEFDSATARTLSTVLAATIDTGGTVRTSEASTVTTHQLAIEQI
jgi:hypothetical protein